MPPHTHTYTHKTPVNGEPPSFTQETPATKVVEFDTFQEVNGAMVNLVLPCVATGTPAPTVAWFREETELDQASVADDGTLAINVTMETASRMGTVYYCVATNNIGPENSTTASLRSRNVNVTHTCE